MWRTKMNFSLSEGAEGSFLDIDDPLLASTPRKPTKKLRPSSEVKFSCSDCSYKSNFLSNLKRHQRFKHKGAIACKTCCKEFKTEAELLAHKDASHSYVCDQCGSTFRSKNGLKYHKIGHTDKFAFICSICKKGYNRKSLYLSHKRTHVAFKPYSCSKCKKSFGLRSNMSRHERQCISDKTYACSDPCCSTVCGSKRLLTEHYKGMHEAPRFSCKCNKSFRWRSGFNKHKGICPSNK